MLRITFPLLLLLLGLPRSLVSERLMDGDGWPGEVLEVPINLSAIPIDADGDGIVDEYVTEGAGSGEHGGPMLPPFPENSGEVDNSTENSTGGPDFATPKPNVEEGSGDYESSESSPEGIVTGVPEDSTIRPVDPTEFENHQSETESDVELTDFTTPFNINDMETGVPEGSTQEAIVPKPVTKPLLINANGTIHGGSIAPEFTDTPETSSELPMESIPPVHWTKTTPKEFTITQKIDLNSAGYQKLLYMLEDLSHRRNEAIAEETLTEFYTSRASTLTNTIGSIYSNEALLNISKTQIYVQGLLAEASLPVRQAYSEIKTLTSEPSFYYIPKRQRYLMVYKIVTDMSSAGQQEISSLNRQANEYCRSANVDTPPYSLGNIMGNMLANGAVLTK